MGQGRASIQGSSAFDEASSRQVLFVASSWEMNGDFFCISRSPATTQLSITQSLP